MNHQILFGFLPSPSSEESVRTIGLEFANQCAEPRIHGAYAVAMENVMKNQAIIKDCDPVSLWNFVEEDEFGTQKYCLLPAGMLVRSGL